LFAEGFAQANDSQGRTEALFGVRTALDDLLDQPSALRPDGARPLQDPAGSPLQVLLVGFGTVFLEGGMAPDQSAAPVGRNSFALLKEFDRRLGQAHIEHLVNQLIRDAVVVLFDGDMVVDVHLGRGPRGQFKGSRRQRL